MGNLFDRFVVEAKDVPPSKQKTLPIFLDIHAASPAEQMEFTLDWARAFPNGANAPDLVIGKYAVHAIGNVFRPIRHDALPFSLEEARLLLGSSKAFPGVASVFKGLGGRLGWDAIRDLVLASDTLKSLHDLAFDPLPRAGEAWADLALAEGAAYRELFTFLGKREAPFVPDDAWLAEARRLCPDRAPLARWLAAFALTTELPSDRASGLSPRLEHNARLLHGFVALLVDAGERAVLPHVADVAFSPWASAGLYLPKLGYRALGARDRRR